MKKLLLVLFIAAINLTTVYAQSTVKYAISFDNVVHHEAEIEVTYDNLSSKIVEMRMSRSSPGRYALHEFAKNVYNVKAFNSKGEQLQITRPDPYQWNVSGHDGTVKVRYTLFADRGDGTYSQFDETHAHMNIPATFMYANNYGERPIELDIDLPDGSEWKVATQLKDLGDNKYYAPNFQYFMDSPIEVSDFMLREYTISAEGKNQSIRLALHHAGSETEADEYFEQIKKVVKAEIKVFGELPEFDFGSYTFLACYMPNVSGDGMEHRNSTICTSTRSLANGGMRNNIGTIAHEFFHAWNVERIRPKSLEPFNFSRTNMSGELWLAEGFTSYYTGLILCRAGLRTPEEYIQGLAGNLSYVLNYPGRSFFNPIEMSYQAPFVDAARSVDPVNRNNTFISYYSYGSALGLAMDLALRKMDKGLNLDGYMQRLYEDYGKTEIAYTIDDLKKTLTRYAGEEFAYEYFANYIFKSAAPDYQDLFAAVGVEFKMKDIDKPWIGAFIRYSEGQWKINSGTAYGGPAYKAGLENRDIILEINSVVLKESKSFTDILNEYHVGEEVEIKYSRFGEVKETSLVIGRNPSFSTDIFENSGKKPTTTELKRRAAWLN